MKVLIISSEVVPFAKTGGLADVAGTLPAAVKSQGVEIRVMMPKYRCVGEDAFNLKPSRLKPLFFNVPMGGGNERASLRSSTLSLQPGAAGLRESGDEEIPVYFIENNKYFDRDGLYVDENGLEYSDNGKRFAFFCRAAIESLGLILYKPDVIHCNDWQTGLIPVYLKTKYRDNPFLKTIKTLYTIHNIAYQGIFGPEVMDYSGLDKSLFNYHQLEFYGSMNFCKAGLVFSDAINTVSEKYAGEIMTPEFGCKMEGVLSERRNDVYGILNGIDYEYWNPSKDRYMWQRYDENMLEGKWMNKRMLQEEMGLPQKDGIPVFGFVSRLAAQKGLDIISEALPALVEKDLQIVMLGKGDAAYEKLVQDFSLRYPEKIKAVTGFDVPLSRKIYAGSDFFLMPSYFEPCGLGQMIAMRYGTIPVVHATGGLADTITDYSADAESGNGFSFEQYSAQSLLDTVERAMSLYAEMHGRIKLIGRIMRMRFSWENSAKRYIELYEKISKTADSPKGMA